MNSHYESVHEELWKCVDLRLQRGDTMVRPVDYQRALEVDYTALTGEMVSTAVRRQLAHAVVTFNRENPDRYVALGVRNSARRAFQTSCSKLGWDSARITRSGPMAIARFKSFDQIRELLNEVGVKQGAIDSDDCIRHALRVASGQQEPLVRHDVTDSIVKTKPRLKVISAEADGTEAAAGVMPSAEAEEADHSLTNEERRKGALVGRVETRVAGTLRKVPRKLMLSTDGSARHLLASRNPATGELEPVLQRGTARSVSRGIDGVWRED